MQVNIGDVVTANDYNTIAHDINEYWGDNYVTNTPADPKVENSKGWGQSQIFDINVNDIITADNVNELVNKVNLSIIQTGAGSNITPVASNDIIKASTYNIIDTNNALISTNRNVTADATITSNGSDASVSRSSWSNSINVTATARFSSYAEARYFFNSGGQLRYSLTNSGSSNDALSWQDLFDSSDIGTIIFSINDVAQTGTRAGNIVSGSGFYELTTTPKLWYSINVDIHPYSNNDLAVYFSRNSSGTEVYVKFVLNNDDSNAETVNGTTTFLLDHKKANNKSGTNPATSFSITAPTHTASAWSGS